jgi:hypothetical protein
VVAAELGVSTLERRVSVGLGLVDTVCAFALVSCSFVALRISLSCVVRSCDGGSVSVGLRGWRFAYPFL